MITKSWQLSWKNANHDLKFKIFPETGALATASMINYYQSHTSCIYMSHMPVTFLSVNTTVSFLFLSSSSKGVVQEQKELWKYVKGNT